MQNAYSRQASVEVERQFGERGTVSVGLSVHARAEPDHVGEPERADLRRRRAPTTAAGPNPTYANNNQYSPVAESNYHGLHLSFVQRPARWGYYRVSYTLSKSMNNVGEFFFSSPIDPFDLSKDWGRSDDDQRHRLVISGGVNSPMAPARTRGKRSRTDFRLSGMLQAYSALPFNITSGVTTLQGTAGRPIVNGEFIERNAGVGQRLLQQTPRLSRTFRVARPRASRRAGGGVQPHQSRERSDAATATSAPARIRRIPRRLSGRSRP